MKDYQVVLADPAWEFKDKLKNGERGSGFKYPVLKLHEIKALKVSKICAKNSVCFLWCPASMHKEAIDVLDSWGFEYKTIAFVWSKIGKNGKPVFGMGRYTRQSCEFCLVGVKKKGKQPERVSESVRQLITSPRRSHSEKPDEIYKRIFQMYGKVKRIELFARKRVKNWDSIGNEIDGMDIREVLK